MLAIAMGPHIKNHVRILGPALIACLGDAKVYSFYKYI